MVNMPRIRCNCYKDIKYLRPLNRLAFLLGLSPTWNSEGKGVKSWHKFYGLLVICLIVAGTSYSIGGRVLYVYPMLTSTVVIVQNMSAAVLTFANVWGICNLSMRFPGDFRIFLQRLVLIDKKMSAVYPTHSNKVTKFYREFVLGHICVCLLYGYDAYLWIDELDFHTFRYYMFRGFQNYINFVLMMVIRNYILVLKYRYQNLNQMIMSCTDRIVSVKTQVGFGRCDWTVREVSKIYTKLTEEVALCNKLFGFPMLFLSLYFVCELLHAMLMCIVYYIQKNDGLSKATFGANLLILCLLWSLKELILFLFIISPCDETTGEAKQTSIICYKLLQELPSKGGAFQESSTRDDLILLAIQSSTRYPTFSAAGFFTVDYTMLFTLLGSITSYLVVLIQFN